MDSASLRMHAAQLRTLPADYYPYFDICHIILCVMSVRKEAGRYFGWDRPFATWVSCIIASFAGSILVNPLVGKPIFAALKDEYLVMWTTVAFFVIFFSPRDIAYHLLTYVPVYATICVLKEILRGKKVWYGLKEGLDAAPAHGSKFFIPLIVATMKGNGSGFATPIIRLVRGVWNPDSHEFFKPSMTTKLCFFAALTLVVIPDVELVYIAIIGLFITVKLTGILDRPIDPFHPFEVIFWRILKAVESSYIH